MRPRKTACLNPKPISRDRGAALVITFVIAMVIFLLVVSWLAITSTRMNQMGRERDGVQAGYTAEAGVTKALWYLSGNDGKNAGWRTDEGAGDTPLSETPFLGRKDRCEVSISDQGGFLQVLSLGKAGRAAKRVSVTLGEELPQQFDFALAVESPDSLVLYPGSSVQGGIVTEGPIKHSGGSQIGGIKSGGLPKFSSLSFDRTLTRFHEILSNPFKATKELFSPKIYGKDQNLEVPGANTVLFVNDAILFQGGTLDSPLVFKGAGILVSTAEIQISGDVSLEGLTLISSGPIKVLDRAKLTECLLYSETSVILSDESSFQGQILSLQDITVGGKSVVRYPSVLYSSGVQTGKEIKGKIAVLDEAEVNGTVISHSQGSTLGNDILFELGDRATVNGVVCAMNRASVSGKVNGVLMARTLYEDPVYPDTLNHNILKGSVDRSQLPGGFLLPLGFSAQPKFQVMAWKEG